MTVKNVGGKFFVVKKNGKLGKRGFSTKKAAESAQARGRAQAKKFGFGGSTKGSKGGTSNPSNPNGNNNVTKRKSNNGSNLLRAARVVAFDPMFAGVAYGAFRTIGDAQRFTAPGNNFFERLVNGFVRNYTGFDLTDNSFDFRTRAGPTYTMMVGGLVGRGAEEITGVKRARDMLFRKGTRKSLAVMTTQLPATLIGVNAFRGSIDQGLGFGRAASNFFRARVTTSSGIDFTQSGTGQITPAFNRNHAIAGIGLQTFGKIMHAEAQKRLNPMVDPGRVLPAVV